MKIADVKEYIATLGISEKAMIYKGMASQIVAVDNDELMGLQRVSEVELAEALDTYRWIFTS